MKKFVKFYSSTIGKKFVVAITGLALFGFIVGHVVGNLKTFMGYDLSGVHHLDIYGEFLRTFGEEAFGHSGFLWLMRFGLLGMLILHVITIVQLRALNLRAKPTSYRGKNYRASTVASRSMMIGGLVILGFVIFHILHLTTGDIHPNFEEGRVYANVYYAFQVPWVVVFYTVAMGFLGLHLYHGIWSLCQTLGIDNPDLNPLLRATAKIFSVLVVVGFLSVPFAVSSGRLEPPRGEAKVVSLQGH